MIQNKQQKHKLEKKQKKRSQPKTELTFLEHIYELRSRLFWVVLALTVASAAGFQFKDQLISLVMSPLHGQTLIYLTPGGGFSFIFTISIYFGALLCIPVAVYHMYRFMEPLLGGTSRKLVATFIVISAALAAAGAAFGYFVTVPAAINFLSTFAGTTVVPSLTAESYLNFVVTYIFGLAALFQVPLLLFIFDHVRPLPPKTLSSTQRYVVIGATVLAAIITPTPDALNMALVAIPIVVVYELGALAVYIRHYAGRKQRAIHQRVKGGDEPLTAIIEELERTQSERERTPAQPQEQKWEFESEQEPEPVVLTSEKQTLSVSAAPSRLNHRSTIDGMVKTRGVSVISRPPAREARQSRLAYPRMQPTRPMRSIDGFSMMSRV